MCEPALLERDLTGKTYIVTGANSGIGFITAEQLAKQGATVVLACRKAADAEACMETIRTQKADAAVEHIPLDLGDPEDLTSENEGLG